MTTTETAPKRVHIKTYGCQMNVYDSDRMRGLLEGQGYQYEADPRRADVILVNTCSIREKAEHKVVSLLGELRPLKQKNPNAVIGVAGCVAQRMGSELLAKAPHLDLVFGPDAIDDVTRLVEEARAGKRRRTEATLDTSGRRFTQPAVVVRARPAEFLTIVKGCDHFCTYCIVPYVRGREKSRAMDEVLDDVRRLVAAGTKEVTFLGQNINTYGKGNPGESLAKLIEQAAAIDGLERIRYVTSHPRDLGDDLIRQFGEIPKLMPALHLPFQAGSDRILKRMQRLYTRAQYLEKVAKLRAARPDIAMSTDVIVGFPGETEDDFRETLEVLAEVKFSTAFLFKYSPRPGTKAAGFEGEFVPESVKEERLKRAQDVAFPLIAVENERLVGTTTPVLVESLDKKERYFSGRNPHNKLVHVMNAGEACVGKILDVEITAATGTNLRGYYVGAPRIDRAHDGIRASTAAAASL